MVGRRIEKSIQRRQPLEIEVDGKKIVAYKGETVATALIAAGLRTFRRTVEKKEPHGMFCGIGLCFECRMVINGVPNTRPAKPWQHPDTGLKPKRAEDHWRTLVEKD